MNEGPGIDVITILKITQTSEHFLKLDYISPTLGMTYGLLRQSKKNNNAVHADLFDTAKILRDAGNHSKQKFIKSYNPIQKRSAIGNNYHQLEYASHFAAFIIENVSNVPDPSDLFTLTTQTLNAFDQNFIPEIIFLKALYRFLKTEGFPIDSGWWNSLSNEDKSCAKILLTTPLTEFEDNLDLESVIKLHKLLCQWSLKETGLKIKAIFP